MDSAANSSSEESIFHEQTRKLFHICDSTNIGSIGKNDLDCLTDLVPVEDLRKIQKFIGEQRINEPAFCRILKAIVNQNFQEIMTSSNEKSQVEFDESQYLKEESLEDEIKAIEEVKSYYDDPITQMLKKELEEIKNYEKTQETPEEIVIKKPLFRPIQPETNSSKVSSLADELSEAENMKRGPPDDGDDDFDEKLAQPDRIFKVVFVGDSAVGKTCFLHRFCHNRFKPLFNATIGVDFTVKTMKISPNRSIAMQLWDTAGQERFRSITKQYFRKADGVVLMFDVTSEQSFLNVRNWIDSVRAGVDESSVMCLVGNKVDLFGNEMSRNSVYRAGEKLAKEFGIQFFETSAYTGYGIESCMQKMAESLQKREDNHLEEALKLNLIQNTTKKSWCCV